MNDLIEFLITNIIGTDDIKIEEETEDSKVNYIIEAKPDYVGLIIGKEGKTIKNLRKIVSIRATLENKVVNLTVQPSQ